MSKNTNKPLSDNPTMKAIAAYAEAKEKIARLTAENERLRKAGDEMFDLAVADSTGLWLLNPFQTWQKKFHSATREGRERK